MGNTTNELIAARIEATLAAYKVNARVWQATISPRFTSYEFTTAAGVKVDQVTALADEIALALGVASVRVYRGAGSYFVEVPRTDAKRALTLADLEALRARYHNTVPPMTAVLGLDEGGIPLMLQLASPDVAHIMMAGTTGSGKTELERTILTSLVQRNRPGHLALVLLDPKGKLAPFADLLHTRLYARTPAEQVAALGYAVDEMDRRQIGALPHLVIVIDELADLLMQAPAAAELLTRLTQTGREYNIHVVAATQRPAAALVGGMVKANFPLRLVGSVVSTDDAKVASGIPGTGAERLLGRGDFLLVAKGNVIRFQAALAGAGELATLPGLGQRSILARQLQAALPEWAGGQVGGNARPPEPANANASGLALAHPPTHPPAPLALEAARAAQASRARTRLADRYSQAELYRAYVESDQGDGKGPNRKRACEALYGYSDTNALALLNAAIERFEAAPEPEEAIVQ